MELVGGGAEGTCVRGGRNEETERSRGGDGETPSGPVQANLGQAMKTMGRAKSFPRGARVCGGSVQKPGKWESFECVVDPRVGLDAAFSGRDSGRLAEPALSGEVAAGIWGLPKDGCPGDPS